MEYERSGEVLPGAVEAIRLEEAAARPTLLHEPKLVYSASRLDFFDAVQRVESGRNKVVEKENMLHAIACSDMLGPYSPDSIQQVEVLSYWYREGFYFDTVFQQKMPGMDMDKLRTHASELSATDVTDRLVGSLECYMDYLETGHEPVPAYTPGRRVARGGLAGEDALDRLCPTAEMSYIALTKLADDLGADWRGLAERHNTVLERAVNYLLCSRRIIEYAVPLINTVVEHGNRWWSLQLLKTLTSAMEQKRLQDEEGYQRWYGFATRVLDEPFKTTFQAHNNPVPVVALPNAVQKYVTFVDGCETLEERYEHEEPVAALLSDGTFVTMPYASWVCRRTTRPESPEAISADYAVQSVGYGELDEGAQRAIDVRRGRFGTASGGTEENQNAEGPHRQRLVLGEGQRLWALAPQVGGQPVDGPYTRDKSDADFKDGDRLVRSMHKVWPGYLVVPYRGGRVADVTYRAGDLNALAPSEANAFWVAGAPRVVDDGMVKWVLMPATYYQIELA